MGLYVFDVYNKYWTPDQKARLTEAVNAKLVDLGCVPDSVNVAQNSYPAGVTVTITNPSVGLLITHDDILEKVNQLIAGV